MKMHSCTLPHWIVLLCPFKLWGKNGTPPSLLPHRSLMCCVIGKGNCCSYVKGLAGRDLSWSLRLSQATATTTQTWMNNVFRAVRAIALVRNTSQSSGDFFFLQRISASNYFYLAAAMKDLPLRSFSLFLHLFHHLSYFSFFLLKPCYLYMLLSDIYFKRDSDAIVFVWLDFFKKERFGCSFAPVFLIWYIRTLKNRLQKECLWSRRKPLFLLSLIVRFIHIHED